MRRSECKALGPIPELRSRHYNRNGKIPEVEFKLQSQGVLMNFSSFLAKVMPGKVLPESPKHPISISWKITRNMEPFLDLVKLFTKLPGMSSLNREMA